MKIKMENVGGLKNFEADIEPNKITYIIAPNAMGKTSFVRGLEAVFGSVDPKEVINVSKNKARIIVKNNGNLSDLTFQKVQNSVDVDGVYPPERDPRSSLISFIMPDSSVVRDITLKNGDLKDFLTAISKANEFKAKRDEAKAKLSEKKEMLEVLRKNAKEVPKLKELKAGLEAQIKELRKRLEETAVSDEAKEIQQQINKLDTKKGDIESIITQNNEKMQYNLGKIDTLEAEIGELEEKIKQIEREIPKLDFKPELSKFEERANEIKEKIAHEVKPELNRAQTDVSKLEKQLEKITSGEDKAGVCPFDKQSCQRFSRDILKTQLEFDHKQLESYKKWYDELNKEYKTYMDKLRDLKSKETDIVEKRRQISDKKRQIKQLEDANDLIRNDNKNHEQDKENLINSIKKFQTNINKLVKGDDKKRKELENEIENSSLQLNKIDRRILEISKQFDPEKSVTDLEDEWVKEIEKLESKVNDYTKTYEKQLYGETIEFNKRVDGFLKILGFDKNFHKVIIDPNTQKLVVYKTATDSQPLNTLSTSERYAIAILIMLIAREIYIPKFSMVVLDELLISFDEERGKKVLDYIKKEVPYVITTALKDRGEMEVKTVA